MRPRSSSNVQSLASMEGMRFFLCQTAVAIFVFVFHCSIAVCQDVQSWPNSSEQNSSYGMRAIDSAHSRTPPPVRSASAETPVTRTNGTDEVWVSSLQSNAEQTNAPLNNSLNGEALRLPERASATGSLRQASVAVHSVAETNSNTQAYGQTSSETEPTSTTYGKSGLALDRPQATDRSKSRSSTGTFQMLLSVGSSLLIVIGLFLGMAWAYKKTMNTSLSGMPKEAVKVLGRTGIAPRQSLMLIRFGPKLVLVSMVQGEMRTISEIDDPLQVDQISGLCESCQPGSITNSFRNLLVAKGETL